MKVTNLKASSKTDRHCDYRGAICNQKEWHWINGMLYAKKWRSKDEKGLSPFNTFRDRQADIIKIIKRDQDIKR